MADNTPWTEIELEYVTSIEELTLRQLAKKYSISLRNFAKKSKDGNWVEKRRQHINKVSTELEKKILNEQVERKKRDIKIVDNAIKVYISSILGKVVYVCTNCGEKNKVDIPKIKPMFRDIDKLIRLQHFILGEPDKRVGLVDESESKRFVEMTRPEKMSVLNELVTLIEEYED